MVHSFNTVLLLHIYSVRIQNTFSKIQVLSLYLCKLMSSGVSSEIDFMIGLSSHF